MFYSYIRIIENKLKKMKPVVKLSLGFAQIPLLIALLLMAIAIPVATNLVQQNQTNQGRAGGACVGSNNSPGCVGKSDGDMCLNASATQGAAYCRLQGSYGCGCVRTTLPTTPPN